MALMLGALRDALVAAGAPDDKAQKAAEEVAGFENRLAKLEADMSLLKWMVGANIAVSLIILGKLLV
jgi:hypothetical protein